MTRTHYAIVVNSCRLIPVIRLGRLLIVLHGARHGQQCISTVRYNERFVLLPADMNLRHSIMAMARAAMME